MEYKSILIAVAIVFIIICIGAAVWYFRKDSDDESDTKNDDIEKLVDELNQ